MKKPDMIKEIERLEKDTALKPIIIGESVSIVPKDMVSKDGELWIERYTKMKELKATLKGYNLAEMNFYGDLSEIINNLEDEGVKLNTIMNYLAGIFYIINIAYAFS